MKFVLFCVLSLALASAAHAAETRITGTAAAELYDKLQLPEVSVQDEHGGAAFATAKYGEKIGCQRDLDSGRTECWILD